MVEGDREGFRVGFNGGVLKAEYVRADFRVEVSIPLIDKTREEVLSDLAKKIIKYKIPCGGDVEIPVPSCGYEPLSRLDKNYLFSLVLCSPPSDRE